METDYVDFGFLHCVHTDDDFEKGDECGTGSVKERFERFRRCGHCESRCPFGGRQASRMEEITLYFGT